MLRLSDLAILESKATLVDIPSGKKLINTINAHSFNTAQKDDLFAEALRNSNYLIPDGVSIVKACRWLKCKSQPKERIAGWDLFEFEMNRLNKKGGRCMFMGSSPKVLALIVEKAKRVYPNIEVVTYSPPYKPEFNDEDNHAIVKAINDANPDLLWIGMTAPKQEKWIIKYKEQMPGVDLFMALGATIDFEAGALKRAPIFWRRCGLEWLFRFIKEPRRLFKRYFVDDMRFFYYFAKQIMGIYKNPFAGK